MNEIVRCIIGVLIPFVGTTLGASVVFILRNKISNNFQKILLGFSAGIMLAASIWSLIIPALEGNYSSGAKGWILVSIGIIVGTIFLMISDILYEKNMRNNLENKNIKMLNFAIVLHNVPEGMAVRNCYCCIYKF